MGLLLDWRGFDPHWTRGHVPHILVGDGCGLVPSTVDWQFCCVRCELALLYRYTADATQLDS